MLYLLKVSGWDMLQDKSNPSYTLLTYVLHFHPGGSLPTWMTNFFIKLESKKVLKMKALVEEAKKPKGLRESFRPHSTD